MLWLSEWIQDAVGGCGCGEIRHETERVRIVMNTPRESHPTVARSAHGPSVMNSCDCSCERNADSAGRKKSPEGMISLTPRCLDHDDSSFMEACSTSRLDPCHKSRLHSVHQLPSLEALRAKFQQLEERQQEIQRLRRDNWHEVMP